MIEIIDMNVFGNGITKIDGAVVFVENAVDGDLCDIQITENNKNFKIAKIKKIASFSENRCDSQCDVYTECGGCSLRHITYKHELEIKKRAVVQAFRKFQLNISVKNIGSASPDGYRNKAIFHKVENGLGYYRIQSHAGVCPSRCYLIPEVFDQIRVFASEYGENDIQTLQIHMGDGGVISVAAEIKDELAEGFASELAASFNDVKSVWNMKRIDDNNYEYTLISGARDLHITLSGVRFSLTPASFFQVNTGGAQLLIDIVQTFAESEKHGRIADIYCGAGTFALTLASKFPDSKIIGIERNADSVDLAKRASAWNGLDNARFFTGDAAAFEEKLYGIDLAVLDPPRAGLSDKMRKQLMKIAPDRIIYVSCNPETLARDCAEFEKDYEISRLCCVDMFPRTSHVESVVLMTRGGS